MQVFLAPPIDGRLRRHAVAALPAEACGLLGGPPAAPGEDTIVLTHYEPMVNVGRAAGAGDRFAMDPITVARVEHALRMSGQRLRGVFHSHPDGEAILSCADRTAAWPELVQLVLAIDRRSRATSELAAFRRHAGAWVPVAHRIEVPA